MYQVITVLLRNHILLRLTSWLMLTNQIFWISISFKKADISIYSHGLSVIQVYFNCILKMGFRYNLNNIFSMHIYLPLSHSLSPPNTFFCRWYILLRKECWQLTSSCLWQAECPAMKLWPIGEFIWQPMSNHLSFKLKLLSLHSATVQIIAELLVLSQQIPYSSYLKKL